MEPHILLAQLKALLSRAPKFSEYAPDSEVHQTWLGQAHALISLWRATEATSFQFASDSLGGFASLRDGNVAKILGILHRAAADVELRLPTTSTQVFGPGAMYDFFKALNEVISTAKKSVLIIDPYMDASVFDTYLSALQSNVSVKLLIKFGAENVKPAMSLFIKQSGTSIEIRKSKEFHDRVVFIDDSECWVLGQSIAHAAASMPAYLAPLSVDIVPLKLAYYEEIWKMASAI